MSKLEDDYLLITSKENNFHHNYIKIYGFIFRINLASLLDLESLEHFLKFLSTTAL